MEKMEIKAYKKIIRKMRRRRLNMEEHASYDMLAELFARQWCRVPGSIIAGIGCIGIMTCGITCCLYGMLQSDAIARAKGAFSVLLQREYRTPGKSVEFVLQTLEDAIEVLDAYPALLGQLRQLDSKVIEHMLETGYRMLTPDQVRSIFQSAALLRPRVEGL